MIAFEYHLDLLADYISAIPLTFFFGFLYNALVTVQLHSIFYWKCLIGILITTITTEIIKQFPYPENIRTVTRRPIGAKNTDFLSKNGLCKKDAPGFPSGHMSSTAFFATISVLYLSTNIEISKFISALLVFMMGWSRWFKGVHNLTQIIGGTFYGIGCAYITSYFI